MAKVTIETHNVTVNSSSGNRTFSVSYSGCTAQSATVSGGTFTPTVSLSSGNLVVQWSSNTTGAGRGCLIVLTASNGASDVLAFNQQGNNYNAIMNGPTDVEGDVGSNTYQISSNVGGSVGVVAESGWIDVNSVTKTAVNGATAVLSFDRNHSDPRFGVVRCTWTMQFNPYNIVFYMVLTQGTYVQAESSLAYTPNSANVGYNGGTYTSPAATMQNVTGLTVRNVSGDMDIQSVDIDSSNGVLVIVYGANNTGGNKSATISVRGTGVSGYISTTFYLYQGTYTYLVNPIWKTTVVEVAGQGYVDYTVSTDGEVIYSGRAYQMPGDENINFELNEIVRDYVDNYLWWREGYQTPSGWERTFTLTLSNGGGGDYIFTKDWSYKELGYSSNSFICLNEPIIDEIPAGCLVPVCVFSPQRAGNMHFVRISPTGGYYIPYTANLNNPRQARYLFVASPGYRYGWANGMVYKGAAVCNTRYVLYYENAYGGIDALPVQGNATATDKITAYTTKNAVRVPSTTFSYRRYLNEIQKSWEFKTGYLSDEQASRMHHLIESTMVYVWDIEEARLYPVVIDENSLTYKTYKNQGRKFFNYSFKVRESQDKIRK